MQQGQVIEVVVFTPAAGYSQDDVARVLRLMHDTVQSMPGFIDRQAGVSAEGQWVDLVWWQSLELAERGSNSIMSDAELAPHFVVFDPNNVSAALRAQVIPLTETA